MSIKSEISKNIFYYRKKCNLSQKKLAEILGVNHTAVSNWENGHNSIDIETLNTLSEVLGVALRDMFGEHEDPAPESLSDDENQLLSDYRALSNQGKEYIRQTMVMALNSYKKDSAVSRMEAVKKLV